MRADRLLALLLLLQARGRTTAATLAEELEVSVRTIYRDLEALSSAGVPVTTESGPGGGCQLMPGYRSPLDALSPEEADALLILGVPTALRQLGLEEPAVSARQRVRQATVHRRGTAPALVHLDLPRWFHPMEDTPHLVALARAVQDDRRISVSYASNPRKRAGTRRLDPLGLVNKAGVWYLVARASKGEAVFRVGRIRALEVTGDTFTRAAEFDLEAFWASWTEEFIASRPSLAVKVRASPEAVELLPDVLGDGARQALASAEAPDPDGRRVVTLSFESPEAAAHRLIGFGDLIEVLEPREVRERIAATARRALKLYG